MMVLGNPPTPLIKTKQTKKLFHQSCCTNKKIKNKNQQTNKHTTRCLIHLQTVMVYGGYCNCCNVKNVIVTLIGCDDVGLLHCWLLHVAGPRQWYACALKRPFCDLH